MNRGFATYFKQAMRSSAKTVYHTGGFLRAILYTITAILARVTLIFSAVFDIADVKQAKLVRDENRMSLGATFRVERGAYSVRTMIYTIILEALIFAAGIVGLGFVAGTFSGTGYLVSLLLTNVNPYIIIIAFTVPGAILYVMYFIIMPILFAPTPYVIQSNPGITAGEVITICFRTMKSRGKATSALCALIPTLLFLLIAGAFASVMYVFYRYLIFYPYFSVICIVWAIVAGIVLLVLAPLFMTARKVALTSLFEDVVLDPINANKHTSGVNMKKFKKIPFEPQSEEENLLSLFDVTADDSIPMENSGVRKKHEAELKARRGSYRKSFEVRKDERKHAPPEEIPPEENRQGDPVKRVDPDYGKTAPKEEPTQRGETSRSAPEVDYDNTAEWGETTDSGTEEWEETAKNDDDNWPMDDWPSNG